MGIIKLKNANEEQAKNIAINEQPVYGVDVEVNENTDIPQENQEQCQDPAVLYEDESRTDEHTRHYVMNNGTAKSVFNAESVSSRLNNGMAITTIPASDQAVTEKSTPGNRKIASVR